MPSFSELAIRLWGTSAKREEPSRVLLALDPGKTTGYAVFHGFTLFAFGQVSSPTVDVGTRSLIDLLVEHKPQIIVAEDYKVYSWKAKQHTWSDLLTPRLLGTIGTLCTLKGIPLFMQMAGTVKQFCSDARLKEWDYWIKGQPHSRDAIRHACYFILFNKEKDCAQS